MAPVRAAALVALAGTVLASCIDAKNDPGKPAVVQGPKVLLPADTAKPDTTGKYQQRSADLRNRVQLEYAVLSAASVMGDRRTVGSFYATDAVLVLGSKPNMGQAAAAIAMTELMRSTSATAFTRTPIRVTYNDSTFRDSGSYVVRRQRPGQPAAEERGSYETEWRQEPKDGKLTILKDLIRAPEPAPAARAATPKKKD